MQCIKTNKKFIALVLAVGCLTIAISAFSNDTEDKPPSRNEMVQDIFAWEPIMETYADLSQAEMEECSEVTDDIVKNLQSNLDDINVVKEEDEAKEKSYQSQYDAIADKWEAFFDSIDVATETIIFKPKDTGVIDAALKAPVQSMRKDIPDGLVRLQEVMDKYPFKSDNKWIVQGLTVQCNHECGQLAEELVPDEGLVEVEYRCNDHINIPRMAEQIQYMTRLMQKAKEMGAFNSLWDIPE